MKITVRTNAEDTVSADAVILPLTEDLPRDRWRLLDHAVRGRIDRVIKSGEFTGRKDQLLLLHVDGIPAPRILLSGLGNKDALSAEMLRRAGAKALCRLRKAGARQVALVGRAFDLLPDRRKTPQSPAFYYLEGGLLGLYRFTTYRTKTTIESPEQEIGEITLLSDDRDLDIPWLQTRIDATSFVRDLVNTPANDMTPSTLATIARSITARNISVKVLGRAEAKREGMNAYLAVAKGSAEEPRFIVLEYSGAKGAPLVLVGKSVTFDSGGYDLKPSDGLERMKYDMAGGAVVLAAMKAAAAMKLRLNLVALLPATENLIGGSATRPGDVVSAANGMTIEIANTDAEGRLTLADAICYARKHYKPAAIVDIATLTGACSMAFGNEGIAMMGTDEDLKVDLATASDETYDRVWPMPLFPEYKEYLKSDVADLKNIGGRKGALLTSAMFLKEFAGDTPWVHLDIAGVAWSDKDRPYAPRGATGCGARLLLTFLKGRAK